MTFAEKRFKNRSEAGTLLAQQLTKYAGSSTAVVLALPRGGVPVGFAIAQQLQLPLDILLVGKLGVPGHEEYAMGAIANGGQHILESDVVNELGISTETINQLIQRKSDELARREKLYRANHPPLDINGRVAILVDDGLATGLTMLVAIQALRQAKPVKIVVAIPVAAQDSLQRINSEADEVVCLSAPERFSAVSLWYDDFSQVSDAEVIQLLDDAARFNISSPWPCP
jgi:putative phosphoribosyl transferase